MAPKESISFGIVLEDDSYVIANAPVMGGISAGEAEPGTHPSIKKAIEFFNKNVKKRLIGLNIGDPNEIDRMISRLDDEFRQAAENKEMPRFSYIGAELSIGISMISTIALAEMLHVPVEVAINYRYNEYAMTHNLAKEPRPMSIPVNYSVVWEGGKHGVAKYLNELVKEGVVKNDRRFPQRFKDQSLIDAKDKSILLAMVPPQELQILVFAPDWNQARHIGINLTEKYQALLKKNGIKTKYGAESGFTTDQLRDKNGNLVSLELVTNILEEAVRALPLQDAKYVRFALDIASSEMYIPEIDMYYIGPDAAKNDDGLVNNEQFTEYKLNFFKKHPLFISCEDWADENKPEHWEGAKEIMGTMVQMGDDNTVSRADLVKKFTEAGVINAHLQKPNQSAQELAGIEAVATSHSLGNVVVGSHRGTRSAQETYTAQFMIGAGAFGGKWTLWGPGRGALIAAMTQAYTIFNKGTYAKEVKVPYQGALVLDPNGPYANVGWAQRLRTEIAQAEAKENDSVNPPALLPVSTGRVKEPKVKVAINGFGRIGKLVYKAFLTMEKPNFEIVAVNDLGTPQDLAHLFKYDSTFGKFGGEVGVDGNNLIINGKRIHVYNEKDPANLPWKDLGVDVVIEATGKFTTKEGASKHLTAGAKRVVITAPGEGVDKTLVLGINHEEYRPGEHSIISNASCTTNCLAPVVQVLQQAFGIEAGNMITVHAATNDQNVLDALHKDLARARSTIDNMIPTKTGAAKAIGQVIPALNGKINGMAIRVPTKDVSVVYFTVKLSTPVTKDEVNKAFENAAASGPLKGIIATTNEPLVSSDFLGRPESSIVDIKQTIVSNGNVVTVAAWYDNEWAYSVRTVEMVDYIVSQESVSQPPKDNAVGKIAPPQVGSTGDEQFDRMQDAILEAYKLLELNQINAQTAAEMIVEALVNLSEPEYITNLQTAIDILKQANNSIFDSIANEMQEYLGKRSHSGLVERVRQIVIANSPQFNKLGGIDFRAIPMITQPRGNFLGLSLSLPRLSNVENMNLSEEINEMQKMVQAGIVPSGERLKEYVAACYQKGELRQHLNGIVTFVANLCKLEEEEVVATDNGIKEVMLILDSIS
jgi:glyceraldehyde 3-phosphate dehydrogenase